MASRERVHSQDKGAAERRPPRPEVKHSSPSSESLPPALAVHRAGLDPGSLSPRDVLQLQRSLGNRAVAQLLARTAPPRPSRPEENRTGLPDALKAGVESLSGLSMEDVRVHYNSDEPTGVQALAFTQGTDIHLAPGQERHLAHEAWHVVQQKRGRVPPTRLAKGLALNDDTALEREADAMGEKALQAGRAAAGPPALTTAAESEGGAPDKAPASAPPGGVLQRVVVQSDWLRIEPPESAPVSASSSAAAASSKKAELGEPTIYTSKSVGGPYVKCTDTTRADYRNQAEAALGSLKPFDALAKRGIIPPSPQVGANPFARAHLIAAEFGGQLLYPNAAHNIRFHARELEYGEWQLAENRVKRRGRHGYITARSTEARAAAETAAAIVAIIRDTLSPSAARELERALTIKLSAADFVPFVVVFDYTDIADRGESFVKRWDRQDARLTVNRGAKPGAVYGALSDLGVLGPLGLSAPSALAAEMGPPVETVSSREELVALLGKYCGAAGSGRKATIANSINATLKIPPSNFGNTEFAAKLKKFEELKGHFTLTVAGDFRAWLDPDKPGGKPLSATLT